MKVFAALTLALVFFAGSSFCQDRIADGIERYRVGDYEGAINELTPFASASGPGYQAAMFLGASYAQLGKDKQARNVFKALIVLRDKADKASSTDKTPQPGPILVTPSNGTSAKITKFGRPFYDQVQRSSNHGQAWLAVELKADGKVGMVFVIWASID
ncbi:MAG TPA: hypothetical protein VGI80_03375, partial [Pyrinomonadaceae bacterium]